ncbi:MAG TPA: TrmH family RNA methyltransferase [Actinomycetota bacterium]|nr:TrmH family RNA methyltransferase [Actinomycetota bacterium]HNL51696.1 TrmH family RNA methyltransferase [Actinomycetota bacterium]
MPVGPHPLPWPDDPRLDPELLAEGDSRNVEDRFRYWRREAIVAELDTSRHPLHIAIENFQHDFNIGSVVRTANAFNVAAVHVVGKRRWNRRGAMVTDRYLHVEHHAEPTGLLDLGLPVLGIDNIAGSVPLEGAALPQGCVLLFGQEGPGLSPESLAICDQILHITQYGSTRSINAGAAAAIAMWAWALQHA